MINIKLFFQDKILIGIESKGHSGYSEKGSDIICSAVSVLMQSLVLGLSEISKINGLECEINDKIPLIKITWPKEFDSKINVLTNTVSESLKQIAQQNSDYIKIFYEEKKL